MGLWISKKSAAKGSLEKLRRRQQKKKKSGSSSKARKQKDVKKEKKRKLEMKKQREKSARKKKMEKVDDSETEDEEDDVRRKGDSRKRVERKKQSEKSGKKKKVEDSEEEDEEQMRRKGRAGAVKRQGTSVAGTGSGPAIRLADFRAAFVERMTIRRAVVVEKVAHFRASAGLVLHKMGSPVHPLRRMEAVEIARQRKAAATEKRLQVVAAAHITAARKKADAREHEAHRRRSSS